MSPEEVIGETREANRESGIVSVFFGARQRDAAAETGRHRLIARLETRHAGQELLDAVLVELDPRVGVFDRND
jgi:hypothetical protein